MEESICHEMVIRLSQRLSSMLFILTFALFISFKCDFHVDPDRYNARNVKKYVR